MIRQSSNPAVRPRGFRRTTCLCEHGQAAPSLRFSKIISKLQAAPGFSRRVRTGTCLTLEHARRVRRLAAVWAEIGLCRVLAEHRAGQLSTWQAVTERLRPRRIRVDRASGTKKGKVSLSQTQTWPRGRMTRPRFKAPVTLRVPPRSARRRTRRSRTRRSRRYGTRRRLKRHRGLRGRDRKRQARRRLRRRRGKRGGRRVRRSCGVRKRRRIRRGVRSRNRRDARWRSLESR